MYLRKKVAFLVLGKHGSACLEIAGTGHIDTGIGTSGQAVRFRLGVHRSQQDVISAPAGSGIGSDCSNAAACVNVPALGLRMVFGFPDSYVANECTGTCIRTGGET